MYSIFDFKLKQVETEQVTKKFNAKIVRYINYFFDCVDEEIADFEVDSFDEAIDACKVVGTFGGLLNECIEFTKIDRESMTAEFKVNGRKRYSGDTFYLSLTEN